MTGRILSDNAKRVLRAAAASAIPVGGMTVSAWADRNRWLSAESSAEPGKWSTDRAPYQREMMDTYNDPRIHTIVLKTSSQVGKSEVLNNILGYIIHIDPAPVLFMQPTVDRMKDYSKKRIAPMIRDTPVLKRVVSDEVSRDSDNTILSKSFVGGHLLMVGANAASALASTPIRDVLADEVSRYPQDVDNEGDPLSLAIVRTTTFSNRKIIITSTPTVKGACRVEAEYELSDQREYYVPCPHCGTYQTLQWDRLQFERESEESEVVRSVHYVCEFGCVIEHHEKTEMLARGEWRAKRETHGVAGFYINALYSVWLSWKELAERFLKAKKRPETLKVFVNTMLGETWDTSKEPAEITGLEDRCEDWAAPVPAGVLLLTAGCDVQANRIEVEVVGWGVDEESWSIDYRTIYGDPSQPQIWFELHEYLQREWECERENWKGERLRMKISATGIDSGGHFTTETYRFTNAHKAERYLAFKGASHAQRFIIGKPSRDRTTGLTLFLINTQLAKDTIFSRLKLEEKGAGYCHFPKGRDIEYFNQLTAEKRVKKLKKFDKHDPHGYSQYTYKKIRARNEALDCRVYAYAALLLLKPNWQAELKKQNEACAKPVEVVQDIVLDKKANAGYSIRKGLVQGKSFVNGWRK